MNTLNFSRFSSFFITLSLSLLLTSCYTKKDIIYFQNAKNFETIVDTDTFKAKLKIGDILSINVSTLDLNVTKPYNLIEAGEGARLIDYLIDAEGNIDYPVLGKIKLVGLSIEEAKELFKKKFEDGQLLKDPVVMIRIKNYRVAILGEVQRPGVYPITSERISILEAIAMAGDLKFTGRRKDVLVVRDFNGSKTYTQIDLTNKEVFNSPVYYLTQNDVVYVQPNNAAVSSASGDARLGIITSLATLVLGFAVFFTR